MLGTSWKTAGSTAHTGQCAIPQLRWQSSCFRLSKTQQAVSAYFTSKQILSFGFAALLLEAVSLLMVIWLLTEAQAESVSQETTLLVSWSPGSLGGHRTAPDIPEIVSQGAAPRYYVSIAIPRACQSHWLTPRPGQTWGRSRHVSVHRTRLTTQVIPPNQYPRTNLIHNT